MQSLRELVDFLLQHDRSIVFGNLGRYPQVFLDVLATIPSLRVIVLSHRPCSSTENRIRIQRPTDPIDRCDLLLYFEPASFQRIEKHALASRVVVLTSHYAFQVPPHERWIDVCYFHAQDGPGTRDLLQVQDFPIQTRNIGLVEIDHANVLILSGKEAGTAPQTANTYVIVDLTHFHTDTLSLYLAFWDAFDVMLEHRTWIDRWVICFSDRGRQAFVRFTQKVIDALFCRTFEHGNVKEHRDIVCLLPFFRSGTIDPRYPLKRSSLGDLPVAIPQTIEEACQVAAMHNTVPLAKNVLWLSEEN